MREGENNRRREGKGNFVAGEQCKSLHQVSAEEYLFEAGLKGDQNNREHEEGGVFPYVGRLEHYYFQGPQEAMWAYRKPLIPPTSRKVHGCNRIAVWP